MTLSSELAVFGPQTALFKKYGDYKRRISEETRKPLSEPITELCEALVFLFRTLNDRMYRYVIANACLPDGTVGPAIRIEIYNGGYGHDELSKVYDFPVAPELFTMLLTEGLVRTRMHGKLFLTERGMERLVKEANLYAKEHPEE